MKKRTDAKKDSLKRDQNLEDLIHDALIEQGWLIPQTEEDVLQAELALARVEYPPMPQELAEPSRIIERLDGALATVADMSYAEIEGGQRKISVAPRQSPSSSFSQMPTEEEGPKSSAYVYVSNDSLDDEPATDKIKSLISELRGLTRERRYEEALELAKQATELEPNYWRAWISYGSLLALLGDLDQGEAIFLRVLEDFSDNSKAVAAALHNYAFAKEVRCGLNPSEEDLREILPRYEGSLISDASRTNTRASLYIHSALSGQANKGVRLIKDHLQSEDFACDMSLETHERGARGVKTYKFLQLLPLPFRYRLHRAGLGHFGNNGTGVAY